MKNSLFIILICSIFVACGDSAHKEYAYSVGMEDKMYELHEERAVEPSSPTAEPVDIHEQAIDMQKKIIKEGEMTMEVSNIGTSKKSIDSLVSKYKGYYGREDFENTNYKSTYYLNIRIPNQSYEQFIAALEAGNGKVVQKNIYALDVTDQYIDITTRLENKRGYLVHYRKILERATTIKEILEVEQYVRTLEEEIESAERRLKSLSGRATYSSLNLQLSQQKEYNAPKEDQFFYRLKDSFSSGWEIFIGVFLIIINLWPFLILLIAGWYIWRKRKKEK